MRWLDGITDSMDMSLRKLMLEVGDGQGSLACCSPWGCKELDTTEPLDNNNTVGAGSALRTTYTNTSFLLLLCFRPSRLSTEVNNILLLALAMIGHSVARNCWENSASEFQPNS